MYAGAWKLWWRSQKELWETCHHSARNLGEANAYIYKACGRRDPPTTLPNTRSFLKRSWTIRKGRAGPSYSCVLSRASVTANWPVSILLSLHCGCRLMSWSHDEGFREQSFQLHHFFCLRWHFCHVFLLCKPICVHLWKRTLALKKQELFDSNDHFSTAKSEENRFIH